MSIFQRIASGCTLFILLLSGCSAVQIAGTTRVDWRQVSLVSLEAPEADPWQLTPLIKAELTGLGFKPVDPGDKADLLARFTTVAGPDLTADSKIVTRLHSLHIEFLNPQNRTIVTAVDYFYPNGVDLPVPASGVKEAFAELRQNIAAQQGETPPPASAVVPAPPATPATRPQAQPPATATMPTPPASSVPTNQSVASDAVQSAEKLNPPAAEKAAPQTSSTSETQEPLPRKNRSPWLPKFQSWGLEHWGDAADSGY